MAELAEIQQFVGQLRRMVDTPEKLQRVFARIPDQFTLGKGHVTFFANKLLYVQRRFEKVKRECLRRGFRVTAEFDASDLPKDCWGDYRPTGYALSIIKARIQFRINEKPHLYPDAALRGWKCKRKRSARST